MTETKILFNDIKEDIIIECPHCKDVVLIEKLNCCIFRHAIMKDTGKQIDPHSSKEICSNLYNKKLIWGCGKPFKIIKNEKEIIVDICDYI
jgi:DNA-directed RNA polymerase subunit RPC12/RpoP